MPVCSIPGLVMKTNVYQEYKCKANPMKKLSQE